ncbi:MAG: gamma-glutamyl-gamma-aminobutyrate hydrolase family protein [Clostridia bacterium]|nr:gamma-glutamyl-gamma-aminobutyrate hydrolase family protein [Clostridia bacterium]
MKVIIGLVAKHKEIDKKRTLVYICDEIKDVLFKNNAIGIGIVPSMKNIILVDQENEVEIYNNLENLFTQQEKQNMISQINLCDCIILSGGSNSDAYEMWVAKYCYNNDIPILGICAGHNNLIRGIGGKTKKVANPEIHNQPDVDYVHSIKIDKSSNFYNFVNTENMKVNSRHKNMIDKINNLTVAAYDEYGNIEVTEDKTKRCFLGMRFHPESLYLKDKLHNQIFKKFIDICKKDT